MAPRTAVPSDFCLKGYQLLSDNLLAKEGTFAGPWTTNYSAYR
jgi:hypothetical protein